MTSSQLPAGAQSQGGAQVQGGAQAPGGGHLGAGTATGPLSATVSAGARPTAGATVAETALVPSPRGPGEGPGEPGFGPVVARLPVEMDVAVRVRNFRVRNLLALEPGRVIESKWNHGNDLPLAAGDVTLAWTEFEVIDTCLAVRVTRLA